VNARVLRQRGRGGAVGRIARWRNLPPIWHAVGQPYNDIASGGLGGARSCLEGSEEKEAPACLMTILDTIHCVSFAPAALPRIIAARSHTQRSSSRLLYIDGELTVRKGRGERGRRRWRVRIVDSPIVWSCAREVAWHVVITDYAECSFQSMCAAPSKPPCEPACLPACPACTAAQVIQILAPAWRYTLRWVIVNVLALWEESSWKPFHWNRLLTSSIQFGCLFIQ